MICTLVGSCVGALPDRAKRHPRLAFSTTRTSNTMSTGGGGPGGVPGGITCKRVDAGAAAVVIQGGGGAGADNFSMPAPTTLPLAPPQGLTHRTGGAQRTPPSASMIAENKQSERSWQHNTSVLSSSAGGAPGARTAPTTAYGDAALPQQRQAMSRTIVTSSVTPTARIVGRKFVDDSPMHYETGIRCASGSGRARAARDAFYNCRSCH